MRHDKVGSVMTAEVVRAAYGTPFEEVTRLFAEHRISGLPVIDEGEKVVGVLSETDLAAPRAGSPGPSRRRVAPASAPTGAARRRAAASGARTAGQLMTGPPVTVHAEATVAEAARTMTERGVARLVVVDEEDRLVGIVTRRDLLQVFLRPGPGVHDEVTGEIPARQDRDDVSEGRPRVR
ncbi:CBS domain-containing protein [Streptomyces sp. NPDC056580]|uniref:CBS domain-containing protein n=1 Tax=Streptomyces sp. NPDC056580 TaxID=3345872 RepID=UPI0036B64EBF